MITVICIFIAFAVLAVNFFVLRHYEHARMLGFVSTLIVGSYFVNITMCESVALANELSLAYTAVCSLFCACLFAFFAINDIIEFANRFFTNKFEMNGKREKMLFNSLSFSIVGMLIFSAIVYFANSAK